MNDPSGSCSQDEALSPHEQLGSYLNNLFVVPTENVGAAFELIMGLIKEQSSQIEDLKRAHAEVLDDNARVRTFTQNAVDNLTREKEELSADLQFLKRSHHELLESHGKAAETVEELGRGIEMLTFNCFGDSAEDGEQDTDDALIEHTAGQHFDSEDETANAQIAPRLERSRSFENLNYLKETCSKCKANIALGWGTVGRVGLAKVKLAREKLNVDQTVAARLDRLEHSLLESLNGLSPEKKPSNAKLEEMSSRVHAVETFLHGFEQPREYEKEDKPGGSSHSEAESTADLSKPSTGFDLAEQDSGIDQEFTSAKRRPTKRGSLLHRGSLLLHLNERDAKTGLTIDDLEQQMSDLRKAMQKLDLGEVQQQLVELGDGLQKQLAKLEVSVGNKMSGEDFETRIREMRSAVDTCDSAETVNLSQTLQASKNDELAIAKRQIMEQVRKLESTKLDKDNFEQQLEQMECDMKSFFEQELLKQQLDISDYAEKTENDLIEIRSIVDSHNDTMLHLRDEVPMSSDMDASMKEEEIIARIQQATDDVRVSLEDRLDKLSSIENEVDGFASQMAEKPSQDQIESMLHGLEKRLGKDEALQNILGNMKIELKKKLTRGEVMALVRHTIKDAKFGVEDSKESLMVGRIPYCLGCSKPIPGGVNGTRAPKMNHDSLPPALGLVSNATLYSAASRRHRRPLQMLRSVPPPRPRPKSAILGKFSASSEYVRVRNNSR